MTGARWEVVRFLGNRGSYFIYVRAECISEDRSWMDVVN